MALGVIPPLCATLGPVLAGPEGCSRGRWRSGPSKWRHTAAPEGRVREHHAPVGALRPIAAPSSQSQPSCQGALRTCRCIETGEHRYCGPQSTCRRSKCRRVTSRTPNPEDKSCPDRDNTSVYVTGQFGRKALRTPPPSGGCRGAEYQRFSFGAPARSGHLQQIRICGGRGGPPTGGAPARRRSRKERGGRPPPPPGAPRAAFELDFTASGALPRRLAGRSPAAGRGGRPAAPAARARRAPRRRS